MSRYHSVVISDSTDISWFIDTAHSWRCCVGEKCSQQERRTSNTRGSDNHKRGKHVRIHTDHLLSSDRRSATETIVGCGTENRDGCELSTPTVKTRSVFSDSDEVKSVSVTEGDSVTLNSDHVKVQTDDQILWMFGPQDTRIADIHSQNIKIYDSNTAFEKRLQMDSQTGSLTIRNIRSEHTGLYKLQIISRGTSYKRFNVNVYARLPVPVITRNSSDCSSSSSSGPSSENCSLVCSAVNVSHVTLSWFKGNSLLSSISVSDLSISLSLPLEVEYQDKNTYSCVLNNPISKQNTHLYNISQLCQPCPGITIYRILYLC
ncbi:CD48 antigen-like [Pseudorasbora parva]|uniref:CD48 antigen-like n=1 Tax=Pseudorasbora parva TaxID=51549 RepID=UPI00351E5F9F